MTINAGTTTHNITPSADGRRYGAQPDGTSGPPPSAITAVLSAQGAGQSAGPGGTLIGCAPLLVHFNALQTIGESGLRTFDQYGYHFDFGYSANTVTYTVTGLLAVRQIGGPLAAHCYMTPGTYTAAVCVATPSSLTSTSTVIIVVQDPDTVFSSSFTVCLYANGEQSGGPAGCVYVDASTSFPTFVSHKRYLFQAGDTFTNAGNIRLNYACSHMRFGKYKTGANPRINGFFRIADTSISNANWVCEDIVVSDLDGVTASGGQAWGTYVQARDIAFTRCGGGIGFIAGHAVSSLFNAATTTATRLPFVFSRGFGLVNCNVDYTGWKGPNGQVENCFFPHFVENLAVLGCSMNKGGAANGNEHVIRTDTCYKIVVAHNELKKPNTNKHDFTMRGKGRKAWSLFLNDTVSGTAINSESKYCVFANNLVGSLSEQCAWKLSFHPTDGTSNEAISYIIVENNTFRAALNTGSPKDVTGACMEITMRGNTFANGEHRVADAGLPGIGANPDWTGPYRWQAKTPSGDDEFTAAAGIIPSKP